MKVVAHRLDGADTKTLRDLYDALKSLRPQGLFVMLASVADEKVTLIAGATPDVVKRGISAGEAIKVAAPVVGGSGGGKPEMAQAGGKDTSRVDDALRTARSLVEGLLSK